MENYKNENKQKKFIESNKKYEKRKMDKFLEMLVYLLVPYNNFKEL